MIVLSIEPLFGTLVNFTAMDKVYTKEITLADKCMIMAAIAYNLKNLVNGRPLKIKRRIRKPEGNSFKGLEALVLAWSTKYRGLNKHF